MKKLVIGSLLFFATSLAANAQQRYGIIDSKYILEKMNDYKDAQVKLDNISKAWQEEIDTKMAEVEKM